MAQANITLAITCRAYLSKHICWVHFFCLFDAPPPPPPPPPPSPLVCFVQELYSPASGVTHACFVLQYGVYNGFPGRRV